MFYGNNIVLENTGTIPAFDVSTNCYITTDIDKDNFFAKKWYEEKYGGYSSVSFVYPNSTEKELGLRSLSYAAEYYYFEAIVSYKGLKKDKQYWTHVKKVFYIRKDKYNEILLVFNRAKWDRDENFKIPKLSTKEEVVSLLDEIKSKRKKK